MTVQPSKPTYTITDAKMTDEGYMAIALKATRNDKSYAFTYLYKRQDLKLFDMQDLKARIIEDMNAKDAQESMEAAKFNKIVAMLNKEQEF